MSMFFDNPAENALGFGPALGTEAGNAVPAVSQLPDALVSGDDKPTSPVGKTFIGAYALAYAGFWIACLMPGVVSLALKIQQLVHGGSAAGSLSLVVGAGVLLPIVVVPIVGRISDRTTLRIGMRRPYILAGGAGAIVFAPLMAFAPSVWNLLLFYALYSVFVSLIGTSLLAVIADQVPSN